jgi:2-(1,2-epoxy-1,2-dihydrophenyl)acetyl-CoA isomerase
MSIPKPDPEPSPSPLLTERDGAVLTLTLNRPEKLNSVTDAMLVALAAALTSEAADPGVRAVVLTGAGRGFCAGQDLGAFSGRVEGVQEHLDRFYHPVLRALIGLDKPVVAAINGVAAGAGLSLALACDLRVAGASATLVQAFVRIGLVPDSGGSWFLPRLVGLSRALEMSMLGDDVPAQEALRIGLVDRVVPDADVLPTAQELAARLAAGPRAVGLIRQLIRSSLSNRLDEQLEMEARLQAQAAASQDVIEGVTAFQEKRPPRFGGR